LIGCESCIWSPTSTIFSALTPIAIVLAKESGIETLARARVPVWIDRGVKITHAKAMVIDGKTTLVVSVNWTTSAARYSKDLNLISSEAVAAAYTAHWQHRLVASVPFLQRDDWCRHPKVAGVKSRASP
jgi:phosphatidylserine/phosphatidylglycerophosphate/cardiolipin synthase-like enzyme